MRSDVPIPKRMLKLPRDPRGYPIPVIVYRDGEGNPHFTINDHIVVIGIRQTDRCSICGEPLKRNRWFAGGPGSAFDPNGTFIDPPAHGSCIRYAMQVCPYLAAPSYGKRIDAKTIRNVREQLVLRDPTLDPARPEVFCCCHATTQHWHRSANGQLYVTPARPYISVEFWRHGTQLSPEEAFAIIGPYRINEDGSITCHRCGMTSHNENDVANRYCGYCRVFHGDD